MSLFSMLSQTVKYPTGFWQWILGLFSSAIPDYAWVIIIFTVVLKLVLSPLDLFQRYKMKKNQQISKKLEPELERLKRQFPNDKQKLTTAQYQLQKAHGYSTFSACLPMAVTLIIFLTMYGGLRSISTYQQFKQYVDLYGVYNTSYTQIAIQQYDPQIVDNEGNPLVIKAGEDDFNASAINGLIADSAKKEGLSDAQKAAYKHLTDEFSGDYNAFFKDFLTKKVYRDFYVTKTPFTISTEKTYSGLPGVLDSKVYNLTAIYNYQTGIAQGTTTGDQITELNKVLSDIVTAANAKLLPIQDEIPGGFPLIFDDFFHIYDEYNICKDRLAEYDTNDAYLTVYRAAAKDQASQDAYEYYTNHKPGFLWIKSLWSPDSPMSDAIPSFKSFKKSVGSYLTNKKYVYGDEALLNSLNNEQNYNDVMAHVRSDKDLSGINGFFILGILAVGLSFLSQFITTRQQKKSGAAAGGAMGGSTMKMMMLIMPIMMGVFAVTSPASFSLYMVTNSAVTLVINLIMTGIIALIFRHKEKEQLTETGIVKYGRRDPNDFKK